MIDQLLRTTPKWKKIFLNKVRLMVLLGGSCSLIVWGCTYLKFF